VGTISTSTTAGSTSIAAEGFECILKKDRMTAVVVVDEEVEAESQRDALLED